MCAHYSHVLVADLNHAAICANLEFSTRRLSFTREHIRRISRIDDMEAQLSWGPDEKEIDERRLSYRIQVYKGDACTRSRRCMSKGEAKVLIAFESEQYLPGRYLEH